MACVRCVVGVCVCVVSVVCDVWVYGVCGLCVEVWSVCVCVCGGMWWCVGVMVVVCVVCLLTALQTRLARIFKTQDIPVPLTPNDR